MKCFGQVLVDSGFLCFLFFSSLFSSLFFLPTLSSSHCLFGGLRVLLFLLFSPSHLRQQSLERSRSCFLCHVCHSLQSLKFLKVTTSFGVRTSCQYLPGYCIFEEVMSENDKERLAQNEENREMRMAERSWQRKRE
jgi:hypothetical protein